MCKKNRLTLDRTLLATLTNISFASFKSVLETWYSVGLSTNFRRHKSTKRRGIPEGLFYKSHEIWWTDGGLKSPQNKNIRSWFSLSSKIRRSYIKNSVYISSNSYTYNRYRTTRLIVVLMIYPDCSCFAYSRQNRNWNCWNCWSVQYSQFRVYTSDQTRLAKAN